MEFNIKNRPACVLLKDRMSKSFFPNPIGVGLAMDNKRFRSIASALKHYRLTEMEKRFVELTEQVHNQNGILTEQQESILEGIYREKKRWSKNRDFPAKREVGNPTI